MNAQINGATSIREAEAAQESDTLREAAIGEFVETASTRLPGTLGNGARSKPLASAIYEGWVRHRRYAPHAHAFSYRMYLLYIDLAELDHLFDRRWLWSQGRRNVAEFRRGDYFGDPTQSIDEAVRDRVARETGQRPRGPIRLLTHLRYFGLAFNPVSFYYCYAEDGVTLETILAEITNTPWKERHAYVLAVDSASRKGHTWRAGIFAKRSMFHRSCRCSATTPGASACQRKPFACTWT